VYTGGEKREEIAAANRPHSLPSVDTVPLPVLHADRIPVELQSLPDRWLCWRYKRRGGATTKPPLQPDGRAASVTDPATWCDFGDALDAVRGRFDGLGLVLVGDGLVALDLDHCVPDAAAVRTGDLSGIDPWAREIVEDLASYTELSPSAAGIRVLIHAALPSGGRNRCEHFEVYDRDRYVTITGDVIADMSTSIEARQDSLDRVLARVFRSSSSPAPSPTIVTPSSNDRSILMRARNASNGQRFAALYDRGELTQYGGDHSAADLALCAMLAYWCSGNAEQMDRLFRQSALMRAKWDSRRGGSTYGARTIARAKGG